MLRQHLLGVLALALVTCSAGCVARASASGEAQAPVTYVGAQTLVSVGSGVWVVRDSSRACYYVSDSYWVYREGTWYRSSSYASGWVAVEASVVPSVIVTRDHTKYVMYRGEANAEVRAAPGGDAVAATGAPASKNPHGGPPGQDDTPGLGNQKKAAGEQPGQVGASAGKSDGASPGKSDGASPGKSDAPKAKDEKPKDEPKAKDEKPKAKEDPKPKDEPKGPPSAPPANGKDDKKKK